MTTLTAAVSEKKSQKKVETHRQVRAFNGLAHVALVFWALVTAGPLIWVLLASFKSNTEIFLGEPFALPDSFSLETYFSAWNQAHIGRYFLNSVFVVAVSTAGTMLFGSMAAYVLARYTFPGNRVLYFLFVSGLAFPTFMALAPLFHILKNLGLLNSYIGLILVYIAYSLPFTVFFLAAFFRTLPHEIDEAATVDGASHTRKFFQIMMPMAKSGLVSITIFNIVGQWNQYLLPLVIMQGQGADQKWVLTQGIANISTQAGYHAEWSTLFAALTLSILPMIVVYAIFQRQIQAGLTAGAVK
ncbi:sugar ABC transporter permease [Actinoplanes lobatus]|uniref:N-acetylglucosamine transport system permease protein n=1 Tax=Actinoplanes lobatus TaxID=113568 RepID=A0A7W7HFK8_9ACTN|nr:carbohydrate ABC transporter permease [Actinoplanes lobatus]MBB4749651.1 N-acetylglucosamine transport system permease protein [Actinoplanes lobatus]GGN75587.1 sugar ABC transporter permease [Actinoplanes lobatus]GIE38390.1 sugar ABC transporter permease [Actinoplanes lobatus]